MKPRFVAIFAFLFAVAVGAIWEIFEFSMLGWWYIRQKKKSWLESGIRSFIEKNPRFFGAS